MKNVTTGHYNYISEECEMGYAIKLNMISTIKSFKIIGVQNMGFCFLLHAFLPYYMSRSLYKKYKLRETEAFDG